MGTLGEGPRPEERELVVLVDEAGRAIGTAPKAEVHHEATPLHRAFSLFLFDERGRTLLQRRSRAKRTWPGVWSNSCCGHPMPGEESEEAARRRLREELGLAEEGLETMLPGFRYRAEEGGVVENELCPVLVARPVGLPAPDPEEVMELQWVDWVALLARVRERPESLSPWCREEALLLDREPRFHRWLQARLRTDH
ncbi:MAG TPA: isopentenyl-diphosphate Delta-isomerase [Thermoanaerobaculia bacterium]|nr:isopentenyl-diphosphate Delta-isomerase [Thermoanaerobaculia bacterium]